MEGLDSNERVWRQLEGDSPDLAEFHIGRRGGYDPPDDDWARVGRIIGRNTNIKVLTVGGIGEEVPIDGMKQFFQCLSENRSIEKLAFGSCNFYDGEIFTILGSFFHANPNLECLKFSYCRGSPYLRSLASAIGQFGSLRMLELSPDDTDGLAEVIQALASHSKLMKLSLRGNTINNAAALSLGELISNSNLKALDFNNSSCSESIIVTWHAMFLSLFGYRKRLSIAPWRAIFAGLQSPTCKLEVLNLFESGINDDAVIFLMRCLKVNTTLRELNLGVCQSITAIGWNAVCSALMNPASALEKLDLFCNGINDRVVITLTDALSCNTKLRELNLECNDITTVGWTHFASILQSPDSALEILDLSLNNINDGTMIALADGLANNNKMRKLLISGEGDHAVDNITADGWAAFARILCDGSSIMATYHSNHTLEELVDFEDEKKLPEDLQSLLGTNRENSKSQAARLKIIKTHFAGETIDIRPFLGMQLKALPHIIAWMSNDCDDDKEGTWGEGFDMLFALSCNSNEILRRSSNEILSLDTEGDSKKRKRESVEGGWCIIS